MAVLEWFLHAVVEALVFLGPLWKSSEQAWAGPRAWDRPGRAQQARPCRKWVLSVRLLCGSTDGPDQTCSRGVCSPSVAPGCCRPCLRGATRAPSACTLRTRRALSGAACSLSWACERKMAGAFLNAHGSPDCQIIRLNLSGCVREAGRLCVAYPQ